MIGKRQLGRPSSITPDVIAEVCELISTGKSLRSFAGKNGIPSRSAILTRLAKDEDFQNQYARACEARTNVMAEEILEISDDTTDDVTINDNGDKITNHEAINRSRLKVDTRKWLMSKMAPRKYGDKVQQEFNGDLKISIQRITYDDDNTSE